ncbi:MAG: glycerol kinase, partial [Desulfobulbaceae bacterium]
MSRHILSIDQGTTSSRTIIFNETFDILGLAQQEFEQFFPRSGWVEHDPEEIWKSSLETCRLALSKSGLSGRDIAAIGITNQRETTILWDRATGEPVYRAIVWQDRRTSEYCNALSEAGHGELIAAKTGLLIDPYFSATKIHWILDNVDGVREKAERGALAFGTVDSFLLWRLTGGRVHATDATNAARTMLFNIHDNCWDNELLEIFQIPASLLPEVCDSSA